LQKFLQDLFQNRRKKKLDENTNLYFIGNIISAGQRERQPAREDAEHKLIQCDDLQHQDEYTR
jgi:hypothetical protein